MTHFSNDTVDIKDPPYYLRKRMADPYQDPETEIFDHLFGRLSDAAVSQDAKSIRGEIHLWLGFLVMLSIVAGIVRALFNSRRSRRTHVHDVFTSPVKVDASELEIMPEASMDPDSTDDVSEADKYIEIDPKVTEFLRRKPWYAATEKRLDEDGIAVQTSEKTRRMSVSSESSLVSHGPPEEGEYWYWLPFPQESEDGKDNEDPDFQEVDSRSISSIDQSLLGLRRESGQYENKTVSISDEVEGADCGTSSDAVFGGLGKPTVKMSPNVDKMLPPLPGQRELIWRAIKRASDLECGCVNSEQPFLPFPPHKSIKPPHLSRFFRKRRAKQAEYTSILEPVQSAAEKLACDDGWL